MCICCVLSGMCECYYTDMLVAWGGKVRASVVLIMGSFRRFLTQVVLLAGHLLP